MRVRTSYLFLLLPTFGLSVALLTGACGGLEEEDEYYPGLDGQYGTQWDLKGQVPGKTIWKNPKGDFYIPESSNDGGIDIWPEGGSMQDVTQPLDATGPIDAGETDPTDAGETEPTDGGDEEIDAPYNPPKKPGDPGDLPIDSGMPIDASDPPVNPIDGG